MEVYGLTFPYLPIGDFGEDGPIGGMEPSDDFLQRASSAEKDSTYG